MKPSAKSNRHIIINAISHCCLAGSVNTELKNKVLEVSLKPVTPSCSLTLNNVIFPTKNNPENQLCKMDLDFWIVLERKRLSFNRNVQNWFRQLRPSQRGMTLPYSGKIQY